jgi:hypothetical protein
MFFIIAEYVNKLYVNVFQVVQVIKIIPDIEVGIKTDIKEWEIKIPDYFSSQEELDKLV